MQIVIIGATMYGMEQAVRLARQGHSVLLTTAGSFPGEDLLGTMEAYWDPAAVAGIAAFTAQAGFSSPVDMKAALLRRLKEAGVTCAFYTRAVAPLLCGGKLCGLLLAGPNGVFSQPCQLVVDATGLQAPSFQLSGTPVILKQGTALPVHTPLRLLGALTAPIEGQHPDLFDPKRLHVVREAVLPRDMTPSQALSFQMEVRDRLLRQLGQRPDAAGLLCDTALPTCLDATLCAPPVSPEGWLRREDPVVLPENTTTFAPDGVILKGKTLPYDPERGLEEIHAQAIGCEKRQVLVCGGGTAGIWAALCAAREKADTLVIERQTALGGTRTQGGVVGAYCGNRNGLFQDMWAQIRSFTGEYPGRGAPNPITEAVFLSHAAKESGLQVRLGCQIFATLVENRRIQAVFSVGEDGLFAHRGIQTVDGTGEGLLCALAGCDAQIGDSQLEMTQNFSQWRRCTAERKAYSHHDQDVLLNTDDREWNRCTEQVLLSTGEYDLYPMLTPRESRRIRGRKTVTLRTVTRGQRWTDTLYDAYSTFDPHGRSFSPEARLGALPALGKARFAAVPLGALLPEQLDGVFITGKAISASQEGSNYLRMNPDVMSMGWIAGKLAADCVKLGCDSTELDLKPLQTFLLEKLALVAPPQDTQAVIAATLLTQVLSGDEPAVFNEVVLARPEGLGELLRRAAEIQCYSKQPLLDMCRMLYHDTAGQARLTALLQQLDEENPALVYTDRQRATGVIRGGVHGEADAYWQMNRLVVLLCQEQCREATGVIASVLAHTLTGDTWSNPTSIYSSARLDSNTIANYDRILCLAHGISQMPDPVFLPQLQRLLGDVAAITPPSRPIWREYLLLRLTEAAIACGGDAEALLTAADLHTDYALVRKAIQKLKQ